ncbi:AfsR/SARP family transcriptional regulator [Streptacidiphilus sp. 4-A2]|nr:AfsR/SARP family transcriptional regulator [Streptacidiphilus sp. 4-A2]
MLGPLEVMRGGRATEVGGPRQLTVLAMLLLEEGSVVSVERLINAVWDEAPPRTARAQIQISVSTLRRLLRAGGGPDPIATRRPGYLLRLGGDRLDLRDFEVGVAVGRRLLDAGDYAAAAAEFRTALALWRGPALSGIDSPAVRSGVVHLEEMRLAATEEHLEAELQSDPRRDVVGELVRLTQGHPLREHLQALLVSTLYRSGRRAEALDAYRTARAVITSELGIEPGPELRQLHAAILRGEPLSVLGTASADPVLVGAPPPEPKPPVPRLLPGALSDFTGRELLLERILASADPGRPAAGERRCPR